MSLPDNLRGGPEQRSIIKPYRPDPELFREVLRTPGLSLGRTIGEGITTHIRESRQPGIGVFTRFARDYCPALASDPLSRTKDEKNRDKVDDTGKITISIPTLYTTAEYLMGGNWTATAIFLYKALEMNPDTARGLMRRLFGDGFPALSQAAMTGVEMVEGLPSGTLDNIF